MFSQLLENYFEWDIYASKAGWVPTPRVVLEQLIGQLDKDTIMKVASKCGNIIAKDVMMLMRGKYDLNAWLAITKKRATKSGFYVDESRKGGTLKVVIKHDMGEKWSLFYASYYERMITDLKYSVTIHHTENTITVNVNLKESK